MLWNIEADAETGAEAEAETSAGRVRCGNNCSSRRDEGSAHVLNAEQETTKRVAKNKECKHFPKNVESPCCFLRFVLRIMGWSGALVEVAG